MAMNGSKQKTLVKMQNVKNGNKKEKASRKACPPCLTVISCNIIKKVKNKRY